MSLHQEETIAPRVSHSPAACSVVVGNVAVLGTLNPRESRMLRLLACLPLRPSVGSLGCPVNLPLGSRFVYPHATPVGCANLLYSSPQPHAAGLCRPSTDEVLATTTKICARRPSGQEQPQLVPRYLLPFLHDDALLLILPPPPVVDCEGDVALLTWATSILGAARLGR